MPGLFWKCVLDEAEPLRVLIHQVDEHRLAAGDVLGERDGRVVAGLHDHALDQVLDAHHRADLDEHARAVLVARVRADASPGRRA